MEFSFLPISASWLVLGATVMGLAVGAVLDSRIDWLLAEDRSGIGGSADTRRAGLPPRWMTALGTGILFGGYVLAVTVWESQRTVEVIPEPVWRVGRIVSHLVLLTALVAATLTDLADYVIPDRITVPGTLAGVLSATLAGDLQIMHVWVDWGFFGDAVLYGQYIPKWIQEHHHWHGLAWSLAGVAAGGGLTWLARLLSRLVLGQEALGFGDVTLMAMIGSFLGWQPVVCVFLLAPFCGIFVGLGVKLVLNRPYVPYGPFLAAAAVLVLMSWRWIWTLEPLPAVSIRRLFGDWQSLLILGGFVVTSLILLLGMVRIYRMIPGKKRGFRE